jgi:predicted dithiol-disulfide oxidoreductase (DUF899 family)
MSVELEIEKLEKEIVEKKNQLTALRHTRQAEPISDYTFTDVNGKPISLSEMFGDKKELLFVHNMGKSCPYCTLWADEYNGVVNHLNNRVPFVVISPDEYSTMKEFSQSRNWKFNIYSSKGNTSKKDLGFENEKGMVMPGVSVITKDENGKLFHVNHASFGPGDDFCGLWHFFDLLPDGANKWSPKYSY